MTIRTVPAQSSHIIDVAIRAFNTFSFAIKILIRQASRSRSEPRGKAAVSGAGRRLEDKHLGRASNTAILVGRNDILAPGAAWLSVQPVATVPFLTFSAQLEIAPWPYSNHHPFDLVSSFTLSSTHVRRFRNGGIEAYV
jgi:hypothetical protein